MGLTSTKLSRNFRIQRRNGKKKREILYDLSHFPKVTFENSFRAPTFRAQVCLLTRRCCSLKLLLNRAPVLPPHPKCALEPLAWSRGFLTRGAAITSLFYVSEFLLTKKFDSVKQTKLRFAVRERSRARKENLSRSEIPICVIVDVFMEWWTGALRCSANFANEKLRCALFILFSNYVQLRFCIW